MKTITMYHNFNILLIITVFIFLLSQGLSHAKEWPFNYSAINVWPLPLNVTLPSAKDDFQPNSKFVNKSDV